LTVSAEQKSAQETLKTIKAFKEELGIFTTIGLSNISFGLPEKRQSLSKLATLSRQINNYFTIYLPYILATEEEFKNIYTIFAGGDDLFLIGPWNKIIEFAKHLYRSFSDYVCQNKEITISAGISIHKANEPIMTFYEHSENALNTSKNRGKDSITVFGETVKWQQFIELEEIKEGIQNLFDKEIINNAMLFRLLNLSEMAKKEEEILRRQNIELKDIECLKWRAMLKYTITRNIDNKLKNKEGDKIIKDITEKLFLWISKFKGAIKIPICQVIYNKRGG
ncbi:MAG: hypothetical protein SNJ64_04300, partial [Endomicrobiia bacterium]